MRSFLVFAGSVAALAMSPAPAPAATAAVEGDPERQIVITLENPPVPGLRGAGSTWKGWNWSGVYRPSVPVEQTLAALREDYAVTPVDEWTIPVLGVHCVVLELAAGQSRATVLSALNADPRVESAQPMQLFSAAATTSGKDYRDLQHSLQSMQLDEAHRWASGRGIRIAVIDTGVSVGHPELAGRVHAHEDLVGIDGDRFDDDRHGTAIAGIIAARADNELGIVGVAPEAELVAFKACWPIAPDATQAVCNSFTLARALDAAVVSGSGIVNLSLTGPADPLLERLVLAALERGIAVVGAVPDGLLEAPAFPSSIAGVIAVHVAGTAAGSHGLSVPAPGIDVFTITPAAGYEYQSGSSMAAAHVSGVLALLRELEQDLEPATLEQLLIGATTAVPARENDAGTETLCLNACAAITQILPDAACPASATDIAAR